MLEDRCIYLQDTIPSSLLKLSADNGNRAVKLFQCIHTYMETAEDQHPSVRHELAQKVLHQVCLYLADRHDSLCHLLHLRSTRHKPHLTGK